MRKVKIDSCFLKTKKGDAICCPLVSPENLQRISCYTNCAWFRIENCKLRVGDKDETISQLAYCGNNLIGEIAV